VDHDRTHAAKGLASEPSRGNQIGVDLWGVRHRGQPQLERKIEAAERDRPHPSHVIMRIGQWGHQQDIVMPAARHRIDGRERPG
jgi:hypothetical protein